MVLFSNEKTATKKTFTFNLSIKQVYITTASRSCPINFIAAEPEEQYPPDNNI